MRQPGNGQPRTDIVSGFGTLRLPVDREGAISERSHRRGLLSVMRSAADLGTHVFVDAPVVVGRDKECDLPLNDLGVSRRHVMIRPLPNHQYLLQDLESTNGTFVNGRSVDSVMLEHGQKIVIGDTVIQFALADEMESGFHHEVSQLVGTDPLTGLPSKQRFDHSLAVASRAARIGNQFLGLMMMDMDGVKQINDTHGHMFGAYVIGETGRLIHQIIDDEGKACRFGGDEFCAFLPGMTLELVREIGEQIRSGIESYRYEFEGVFLKPTISVGIASLRGSDADGSRLIVKADEALYRAKRFGKNQVSD